MVLSSIPAWRPPTEYLFIDGGCLRATVQGISKRYLGHADGVAISFAELRREFDKVFYYDAVPAQEYNEEREAWIERIAPQTDAFAKIRALPGFHVQLGDLRGRAGNQRQKRVDVQIAVDMLLHTFRNNMERCTLLAGDVDFQPLLEALIREGMFVDVWHPPQASSALLDAADSAVLLTAGFLGSSLRRQDGRGLMADQIRGPRVKAPADVRHVWGGGEFGQELRHAHGGFWLIEQFELAAPGQSLQIRDSSLRVVVETARDLGIEPDEAVLELVSAEAA
jgi:uncharacterized LabA/DUF88 family protein